MNKIRRRNKNFYILKHYTLKYLLILFLLISALPIQAEDKIIDGIKIRWAHSYSMDEFVLGDHKIAAINYDINMEEKNGFTGRAKFPLTITFPETASSWTFRQAYFDFVSNERINDIPPAPETSVGTELTRLEDSGGTSFNMTQVNKTRIYLKENFLPKFLSSSQLSNLPTNWAISYDIERTAVSLGYMWGLFLPIGEMHRLFKLGLGVGIGRIENKIKINLCDTYTVKVNYKTADDGKKEFKSPHEGKCINQNILANLSYIEGAISTGVYVSLWERVSKDSVWTFFTIEMTRINSVLNDHSLEALDGEKAEFSTFIFGTEILTYTYRF